MKKTGSNSRVMITTAGILFLFACSVTGGGSGIPIDEDTPPPAIPADPTGTAYYVDTAGSDSNAGTSTGAPFKTLNKAVSVIQPGEVIYVRGGTHLYPSTPAIGLSKNGSLSGWYYIWAYPGEQPILDFQATALGSSNGIYLTGSYWYIKGIEITRASKNGIRITGNYNIIEQCATHHNNDSGLQIGLNKGVENNGSLSAWNQVINCDSYLNCDIGGSTGDGGNADGFACKLNPGVGNVFTGCRSWENSDDGWDLYMADYKVVMDLCWTWHNGDPASYSYSGSSWSGNGNGFKVGGGDDAKANEHYSWGHHVLTNCIAFNMNYGLGTSHKAFDRNNNRAGVTMLNCLAFDSIRGFYFSTQPEDGTHHVLKNCAVFGCGTNYTLSGDTVLDHNSWNLSLTPTAADFQDLSETAAKAARGADGSLPLVFGRLEPGSPLIGAGIDVGTGTTNLGA
ncbi:MAG: hypothetical protein JW904_02860 [Spirochaetales bacterium]|nr:hypothetical protein [Spirochaetales bacterium]